MGHKCIGVILIKLKSAAAAEEEIYMINVKNHLRLMQTYAMQYVITYQQSTAFIYKRD